MDFRTLYDPVDLDGKADSRFGQCRRIVALNISGTGVTVSGAAAVLSGLADTLVDFECPFAAAFQFLSSGVGHVSEYIFFALSRVYTKKRVDFLKNGRFGIFSSVGSVFVACVNQPYFSFVVSWKNPFLGLQHFVERHYIELQFVERHYIKLFFVKRHFVEPQFVELYSSGPDSR
jgi:hypothetical protein